MILEKEADLMDKQSEISEIEDKFTSILYTLGQELSRLRLLKDQVYELKHGIGWEIETPSYLKALMMER